MKTRAAILNEMGVSPPYAESKPLSIREVELDPPGQGDLADDKLGLARQLGATQAFNSTSMEAAEAIREATAGGVEYAFEMAGSVRAMELAYKITRRGGMTVTAGLPPPSAGFSVPQGNLVAEERTIKGSYVGTCVPIRDVPRYIALYRAGRLLVDRLMSHRLS